MKKIICFLRLRFFKSFFSSLAIKIAFISKNNDNIHSPSSFLNEYRFASNGSNYGNFSSSFIPNRAHYKVLKIQEDIIFKEKDIFVFI